MAFSRVKPSGWAFGEVLTSAQQNQLDIDHANAVDGVNGGSYSLAAPLLITGDLVTFDDVLANGDIDADNITASGQLTGAALQTSGPAEVGTNLTVINDLTTEDLIVTDDATIGGQLSFTGTGRMLETSLDLPNSNSSVDIATYRNITAYNNVTATRTYTITCTDVADGDWFIFYNTSGFSQNLAGLVTATITNQQGVKYIRRSGAWALSLVI